MSLTFQKPAALTFLRLSLSCLVIVAMLAARQLGSQLTEEGLLLTSLNFRVGYWVVLFVTAVLLVTFLWAWTKAGRTLLAILNKVQKFINQLGTVGLILFLLTLVFYPLALFGFYGKFLEATFVRLFVFLLTLILCTSWLASWRKSSWLAALPAAVLALAATYSAATFFNQVSTYPFSLEWSEISRYYQASFYFSDKIYGVHLPLPVTHPSRYLLQSIPFLITNSPLWLHRLWQALLWVSMPLVTAWALARRLKLGRLQWLFIAWSFLFLMQGAVFYHLLPCVFIVLLGFDKDRAARSFLFVALASIWAGISRVNWIPLPGALAALLYFIEVQPARKNALSFNYLWQPALYTVGGSLIALGSYALYIANSGVSQADQFGSSFTSALLWNRLLPSGPFPPGILPGILLVSAPLLALIWLRMRPRAARLGAWRSAAIAAMLLIFFTGGLVVSVKIGGGTNLHNLDAYMVLLWVLAASLAFGAYQPEGKLPARLAIPWPLLAGLLAVPILFAVFSGGPLNLPNRALADDALSQIKQLTAEATANGGRVLFISQRHLLTFHMVEVPLVRDYEKLFLMEMAISHNDEYLSKFWDLVDDQRFALIITDSLNTNINDESADTLAEENNAWVREVSKPVLCAYEPLVTFQDLGIQVLHPRERKCDQ
jgi:hypothetical protein